MDTFSEKKKKFALLNMEEIKKYPEIEICDYQNIKNGKDFVLSDGYILKNEILTNEPESSKSYAFCSDTSFKEDIIPIIKEADLLYHESTFLQNLKEMAIKTGHSQLAKRVSSLKKQG